MQQQQPPPSIPPPSEEQQRIIDCMKRGDNCVVGACAGSGKSTTVLACALQMPETHGMQITYNAALRQDVKQAVARSRLPNLEVHTYHSLAVNVFGRGHTDKDIREILCARAPPLAGSAAAQRLAVVELFFLDESQDMTHLYFHFLCYVMSFARQPLQVMVLGDHKQGLYEFKQADTRFLTLAEAVWTQRAVRFKSPRFHHCTLRTSYRITRAMARFVNEVMLGEDRLVACKDNDEKVVYLSRSWTVIEKYVLAQIRALGDAFDQIFILALSVNGLHSNIRKLENALVQENFPIYVPFNDTAERIDERVAQGKIVFSTFHSVKGRQRKYVFVVNFDGTFFRDHRAGAAATLECPNALYVACTRATDKLFLLECQDKEALPFLRKSSAQMLRDCPEFLEYKGLARGMAPSRAAAAAATTAAAKPKTLHTTPTKLIKFLPEDLVERLSAWLETHFARCENDSDSDSDSDASAPPLQIPSLVQTAKGFFEDVSDLNGIAIPNLCYDRIFPCAEAQETLLQMTEDSLRGFRDAREHSFFLDKFQQCSSSGREIADYLFLANLHLSINERLYYRLNQIQRDEHDWLGPDIIDVCTARLRSLLLLDQDQDQDQAQDQAQDPCFEHVVASYENDAANAVIDRKVERMLQRSTEEEPAPRILFSARVDLLTASALYEVKCTSETQIEHFLQLAIYLWLWRTAHPDDARRAFLINLRNNEKWELRASNEELDCMMQTLLLGKYGAKFEMTDDEFLARCASFSR